MERPRTHADTQLLQIEIALGTHRSERYRAMARRLGCSHVWCWRVARKYRRGLIPMLPGDEQGLVALRESLAPVPAEPKPEQTTRRLYEHAQQPAASHVTRVEPQTSNPYRVMAEAKTLREWRELERRSKRRGGWFRR